MEKVTAALCTCSKQRQAPVFPVSGLCLCLLHCLPLGTDTRLAGHPPGPMATVCTEKWSLTGTVSVLAMSKPDCSCRCEQKHLYFTAHLTVHKVILGIPSARLLCPCAHSLAQLSPMQMVQPGFPQQHRLSSLPINKSILYSERVWICNWSRLNTFHSNKS